MILRLLNILSPKLETERLILRRYNESDIDAFYEFYTTIDFINITFPDFTVEQELEYIRTCMSNVETDKCEKWSMVLREIILR